MDCAATTHRLYLGLQDIPVLDAHTHLVGGRLGARGLHDILLYHMAISDLYAAGCPTGARLTQYPGWPDEDEARERLVEALPYLPRARNTSTSWGIRLLLEELYDWREPVTPANWQRLDAIVRERAGDRTWPRQVMARARVERFVTELARRGTGADDDILQYSLEWAFFTRVQWGEHDTALYELERCWGRSPESPMPIGSGPRPAPERTIRSLADVHAAIDHYVAAIPVERVLSMATHVSTDIDYAAVDPQTMAVALARRSQAGTAERDIYAAYINEVFLDRLERTHGDRLVFQFSLGAEPLPYETGSRLGQRTIAQLAHILSRHPKLRFQCFLASRHANQALCSLARELPNLSLAGYWWHNFFPSSIRQLMEERLDMLPANKQVGHFSDAYCVEWAYAKLQLVRRQLAAVLARSVAEGRYGELEALDIARAILWDSPRQLLRVQPACCPQAAGEAAR